MFLIDSNVLQLIVLRSSSHDFVLLDLSDDVIFFVLTKTFKSVSLQMKVLSSFIVIVDSIEKNSHTS